MDTSKVTSVKVEDIDRKDYPDFCDAFISYAELDGEPMTDEQLEELNNDHEFLYEAIMNKLR